MLSCRAAREHLGLACACHGWKRGPKHVQATERSGQLAERGRVRADVARSKARDDGDHGSLRAGWM
jgi:hypothetical protein